MVRSHQQNCRNCNYVTCAGIFYGKSLVFVWEVANDAFCQYVKWLPKWNVKGYGSNYVDLEVEGDIFNEKGDVSS